MKLAASFLTILTLGAIGGIIFTLATHPEGVKATIGGLDKLYATATNSTLGVAS